MVRKDLPRLAGDPYEELDELNVPGRYIVDLLAPRRQRILRDEQDYLAVDGTLWSAEEIHQLVADLPDDLIDGGWISSGLYASDTTPTLPARGPTRATTMPCSMATIILSI